MLKYDTSICGDVSDPNKVRSFLKYVDVVADTPRPWTLVKLIPDVTVSVIRSPVPKR